MFIVNFGISSIFRYVRDTREFSFFIYEDNFVVNALNELVKALQAETNAVVSVKCFYVPSFVTAKSMHQLYSQFFL